MLLRVHAGPHSRRHCPVSIQLELPPNQALILLQEPGRRPRACQVETTSAGSRLWWMLSRLEPGQTMDYRLKRVAHRKQPVSRWRSEEIGPGQWQIALAGVPVMLSAATKDEAIPKIGPFFAPGNTVEQAIGGLRISAALSGISHQRTQVSTMRPEVGPVFARLQRRGSWLGPAGEWLADERVTCTLFATPARLRLYDFDVALHAVAGPVRLATDVTAGLLRIEPGSGPQSAPMRKLTNSSGATTLEEVRDQPAVWVHVASQSEFAIFDHPSNPGSPNTWRIGDDGVIAADPFAALAQWRGRLVDDPPVLAAGEELAFRYRLCLQADDVKQASIRAHYLDFAFPPRIEIVENTWQ